MKKRLVLLFVLNLVSVSLSAEPLGTILDISSENDSPAKRAMTSIGFMYQRNPEVSDDWKTLVNGEFGNQIYRIAFFQSYEHLDSLYRSILENIDVSLSKSIFCLGLGYGVQIAWVSSNENWYRHKLKLGASIYLKNFKMGIWSLGFTDEKMDNYIGIFWNATKSISLFMNSNLNSVILGDEVCFDKFCMGSSYTFPGFSVSLNVSFFIGKWGSGLYKAFGNENLDSEGIWVKKKYYFEKYE